MSTYGSIVEDVRAYLGESVGDFAGPSTGCRKVAKALWVDPDKAVEPVATCSSNETSESQAS